MDSRRITELKPAILKRVWTIILSVNISDAGTILKALFSFTMNRLAVLEFTFLGTNITANLDIVINIAIHVFLNLLGTNVCEKLDMDQVVDI